MKRQMWAMIAAIGIMLSSTDGELVSSGIKYIHESGSWVNRENVEAGLAAESLEVVGSTLMTSLASIAVVTASSTSQYDTTQEANDGVIEFNADPRNRWTCWGSGNSMDWLQFSWSSPKQTDKVKLYIYDDSGGVQAPLSYNLQYWNHDGSLWVDVPNQQKNPSTPVGNTVNTVTYPAISTTQLRVVFTHQSGVYSGVTEVEIFTSSNMNDDFNDGDADGWQSYGGTWSVAGGVYSVDGGAGSKTVALGTEFSNFTYEADVTIGPAGDAGLIFRATNPFADDNGYDGYYAGLNPGTDTLIIGKANGASWQELQAVSMTLDVDKTYRLKVAANGAAISVFVDDIQKASLFDSSYNAGMIGLRTYNAVAAFDNVGVSVNTYRDPVQSRSPLLSKEFLKLPLGRVKARGWLKTQLELQRDGLTGSAEELYYWLRLPSCGWLGGDGEDSWEKAPYYVKGLVALAYTLDDAGLKEKVTKWVDWVLQSQGMNGWFGPPQNDDWWARMPVLYYLRDYYEVTGDVRIIQFFQKYFAYQSANLPSRPLSGWGKSRGGDNLDVVLWLYNVTGDSSLLSLANVIKSQTSAWSAYYDNGSGDQWFSNHIVNFNQGMKSPLLWYQMTQEAFDYAAFQKATATGWVVQQYGRVDGMVSGTEPLSNDSSTEGTELCAIVERILSSGYALELGLVDAGDQMERVAFNALPADLTPNIKGLRYYILPNQVQCVRGSMGFNNDHQNGIMPGPHSGFWCCNNNFHFGWPKFVQQLWMASADRGLAAMAYSPSEVTAKVGTSQTEVTIVETTDYPFRETIQMALTTTSAVQFPLKLRIPGWCATPSIRVNGTPQGGVTADTFYVIDRTWENGDIIELTFPMSLKTSRWINNSVAVERGPLVYSLAPNQQITIVNDYGNGFVEKEIRPTTPWNYALDFDPADPAADVTVQTRAMSAQPFNAADAPVVLQVPARQVSNWVVREGSVRADEVPWSPVFTEQPQQLITLVPYGSTEIRVTYFPLYSALRPIYQTANVSASHTWSGDTVGAMNDGILPKSSNDGLIPRYTWWDHLGSSEWVQYEWSEAKPIDRVEVYWFSDGGGCLVPESWNVQYWNGNSWMNVSNPSGYGTAVDQFNVTTFDLIFTTKLKINVQGQSGHAGGILEWVVQSADLPVIELSGSSDGSMILSWDKGSSFNVETNTNLNDPDGWGVFKANVTSPVTNTEPSEDQIFYRLSN